MLVPTYPCEKVAGDVNAERLLDVGCGEVIVTVPATRAHLFRRLGRKLGQTLDSIDVRLLLCCRKGGPSHVSKELQPSYGHLRTIPGEPEHLKGCTSCIELVAERLGTAAG